MASAHLKPSIEELIESIRNAGISNAFQFVREYPEKEAHKQEFDEFLTKMIKEEQTHLKYLKLEKSFTQTKSLVKSLTKMLEDKQKYITELESTMNELGNNLMNTDRFMNQEVAFHNQKQLLRDYNEIQENFAKMQKELESMKVEAKEKNIELSEIKSKERTLVKLLYRLSRKGVPIEKMIEEENSNRDCSTIKSQSESEVESSLFLPINIDSPRRVLKPAVVPELDLNEITQSYSKKISKKNDFKRNKRQ